MGFMFCFHFQLLSLRLCALPFIKKKIDQTIEFVTSVTSSYQPKGCIISTYDEPQDYPVNTHLYYNFHPTGNNKNNSTYYRKITGFDE